MPLRWYPAQNLFQVIIRLLRALSFAVDSSVKVLRRSELTELIIDLPQQLSSTRLLNYFMNCEIVLGSGTCTRTVLKSLQR